MTGRGAAWHGPTSLTIGRVLNPTIAASAAPSEPRSPLEKRPKKENAKLAKENARFESNDEENEKETKSLGKRNKVLEAENEELLAKLNFVGASAK